MIANIVDIILNLNLLFLLTIGFFSVSAGEFLNINNTPSIDIIILNIIGNSIIIDKYGIPINKVVETIKQIQLFVACNPKDGILIMLYIIENIITSLNIPRINDINIITINFENVRYILTRPYSISFNLISL